MKVHGKLSHSLGRSLARSLVRSSCFCWFTQVCLCVCVRELQSADPNSPSHQVTRATPKQFGYEEGLCTECTLHRVFAVAGIACTVDTPCFEVTCEDTEQLLGSSPALRPASAGKKKAQIHDGTRESCNRHLKNHLLFGKNGSCCYHGSGTLQLAIQQLINSVNHSRESWQGFWRAGAASREPSQSLNKCLGFGIDVPRCFSIGPDKSS